MFAFILLFIEQLKYVEKKKQKRIRVNKKLASLMWKTNFRQEKIKVIKENNDSDSASETLPYLDDKI